ncbi:MAG: DNA polymerase Y family protein [Geminicoccaceae bacterium]
MERRYVSVFLPYWPTERLRRQVNEPALRDGRPLALIEASQGGTRLAALDALAAERKLQVGMLLTDARAACPELVTRPWRVDDDLRALRKLVDWSRRYSPLVAGDGADGFKLDITGCAHLFGGEANLLRDLTDRLRQFAITGLAASAPTPLAAWAWARFGGGGVLAREDACSKLSGLPVAALRLPEEQVHELARLGLHRIEDLDRLSRKALAQRFGTPLLRRLDRLFGDENEPLRATNEAPALRERLSFVDPIGRDEDIEAAFVRLAGRLRRKLEDQGLGARKLQLELYRVDGEVARFDAALARPSREPGHWWRLLRERLDGLDVGYGIETMVIAVLESAKKPAQPCRLDAYEEALDDEIARLIDRLAARFGRESVQTLAPVDSHIPERVSRPVPALAVQREAAVASWALPQPRPVRLLPEAESIQVIAALPDHAPARFTWRKGGHRVVRAEGPERIAAEWWRHTPGAPPPARDYYRVEDEQGARFWLYREGVYGDGPPPRWFIHGVFG